MSRKAYLYMRFSSAEQAKGDSLERQRSLAAEYIASHPEKSIELVEDVQFVDEGVSSFAGQNLQSGRALRRVLEHIDEGKIAPGSILMVESLDRLSRQQVIQAQRLLLDILLSGVSVITTSPAERREYDGRAGLHDLILALAGMERANQESEMKSDRVRRAWKRKKANAAEAKLTSRTPSWLKLDPDRKSFTVIEEKAAVIRRIFALAETLGQQSIVRVLNAEGVPPLVKGGTGWQDSSVAKVLTNPAVIGTYQPHERRKETGTRRIPDGPAVEDYYPALVDKEVFYRVQALRSVRKQSGAGRKGKGYTNLFGGIAKCASCRAPMVVVNKGKPPKGGQYLVCSIARRGAGCEYRAQRYWKLERAFLMYVKRLDVTDILPGHASKSEAVKLRKLQSSLRGEIEQKQGAIRKLVASVDANGGDMPRAIHAQLTAYERRIDEIEVELSKATRQLELVETEAYQIEHMQDSFSELLMTLHVGSDEDRYVLRSKLHGVLKAAIARIDIGEASEEEHASVVGLWAGERFAIERPPFAERLTAFKVHYKNGNSFELFLDSVDAVAQRFTYTPDAIASLAARNHWDDRYLELVTASYRAFVPRPVQPPRGENGKFARRVTQPLPE